MSSTGVRRAKIRSVSSVRVPGSQDTGTYLKSFPAPALSSVRQETKDKIDEESESYGSPSFTPADSVWLFVSVCLSLFPFSRRQQTELLQHHLQTQ